MYEVQDEQVQEQEQQEQQHSMYWWFPGDDKFIIKEQFVGL